MLGQINTFPHNGHDYVLVETDIALGHARYAERPLYDLYRIDVKWGMKSRALVFEGRNLANAEDELAKLFANLGNRASRTKARQLLALDQDTTPIRKPAADPNRKFGQGLPTRSLAAPRRTLVSA